jgi:hypothetical protein
MSSRAVSVDQTLPMTVANTGFMLDRLGQDCSPLQFLRELTQNSIEAIQTLPDATGQIIWDVDWDWHALTGVYKLSVTDTGVGMTGEEMERYINQLSSSAHEQTLEGNFGVGAKIAAATRNHAGMIYLSWKDGAGSLIHLWRDPATGQYGLKQIERPGGSFGHWGRVEDAVKPAAIATHGTKVVLLGNEDEQNTMLAPEGSASPSRWVTRYLNTRYFRFPAGITVKAREGWENPRADTDRNVLRTLHGQKAYLDRHASASGTVELSSAVAHWWVLKNEDALSQNSGWVASSGHMAALFQDELYEMVTGRSGVARLQMFGIIFGYPRVVIYVEPRHDADHQVTSNTSRTALLINSEPLPWADWATEFRQKIPEAIQELMAEVSAGAVSPDHKQAIRDRLRQIQELFRFSKYRLSPKGNLSVDPESIGAGGEPDDDPDRDRTKRSRAGGAGGRTGNVYALFLMDGGEPAEAVTPDNIPDVIWLSAEKGTRQPPFLEDRAATYLIEQNLLQINADFRGFTDMVDRWSQQYGDGPGVREAADDAVREWFEQALVETVLGILALKDSQRWTSEDISTGLSEEALTAAVMPRYHIDVAVKRTLGTKLGSLRERAS